MIDAARFWYNRTTEVPTTITTEQEPATERSGIKPVAIEDPDSGSTYHLVRADIFQKMRELVEIEHSDPSLYEYEDFRPIHETP